MKEKSKKKKKDKEGQSVRQRRPGKSLRGDKSKGERKECNCEEKNSVRKGSKKGDKNEEKVTQKQMQRKDRGEVDVQNKRKRWKKIVMEVKKRRKRR